LSLYFLFSSVFTGTHICSIYILYFHFLVIVLFKYRDWQSEELRRSKCELSLPLKAPVSHTGRLFFFCKIIIDFSALGYQLRWPRSLWAFFSSSKNLTPTDPARFYPHKSHGSGAARDSSISSSCLLAEHLSLYRSRPFTLLHSTRELSSGHTAGFVDICGYTVCTKSTSERRQQNRKHAAWRDQTSNQSQHYCRGGK